MSTTSSNQPDKAIDAANRLLQVDPNNLKAIFASVYLKKQQCSQDASTPPVSLPIRKPVTMPPLWRRRA